MDPSILAMLMGGGGGLSSMFGNNGSSLRNASMGGGMANGLAQLFGGAFGNSSGPYDQAQDAYSKYFDQGTAAQQPYAQAGQKAIGSYQDWLQGQKDPSGFINNIMGQYQESPWAKYSQQQGIRAAQNAGSASGLSGSTPLTQFAEQQAQGISSQDMQNWLGNVLGINTQYGQGQQNLINGGQNSANALSQMYGQGAGDYGKLAYGSQAGQNQDQNNIFGGLSHLFFG
jgi:hypothetical protein